MDVSDASYYVSNETKKNKGSQMGHTKKKKKYFYGTYVLLDKDREKKNEREREREGGR
jgi:hypothetical protein